MSQFAEKYVNPFTDYGFNRLFGEESTPEQINSYEDSLKYYRDLKNSLDTAFEEDREEGGMAKAVLIAKEMLKEHEPLDKIARYTGLTKEQIQKIERVRKLRYNYPLLKKIIFFPKSPTRRTSKPES